ncbi:MAG: YgiW/YdeI family stress tolerance OB fold protein [Deltaproteobacteria bacterium]|jgi:uncharacterized protein (TIGR00156 family)|nr:YgiW/YdeI family stress tolerance OB fold protein [Deltaproteobacteria bacterium]
MKKLLLSLAFLLLALPLAVTSVRAADSPQSFPPPPPNQTPGGFSGPGPEETTVEKARQKPDDSYVILRGHIVRHLGSDKYLFRDSSGEINLDVDRDKWMGQTVTPEDTVVIHGEVDRDWNSLEIDVDSLAAVK